MKYIQQFESFEPGPAPDTESKPLQRFGDVYEEGIYSEKLREILNELKSKGDEVAYFLLSVEYELQNDGYELVDIDNDDPYYLEIEIDGKKTWKKVDEWTNQLFGEKRDGKFGSMEMDIFMKRYISQI